MAAAEEALATAIKNGDAEATVAAKNALVHAKGELAEAKQDLLNHHERKQDRNQAYMHLQSSGGPHLHPSRPPSLHILFSPCVPHFLVI